MKSLRRMGNLTSLAASIKSFEVPPKNSKSVKMLEPLAPACSYAGTTSVDIAFWSIQPFDGDLRLNSAIIPLAPSFNRFAFKE
jgi:hypothetical protein